MADAEDENSKDIKSDSCKEGGERDEDNLLSGSNSSSSKPQNEVRLLEVKRVKESIERHLPTVTHIFL